MRIFLSPFLCLAALTMFFVATRADAAAAHLSTGAPAGFDGLASSHVIIVDVYFGETKIAESIARHRLGTLSFRNPGEILEKVPNAIITPELRNAVAQDLPTNSEHACAQSNANACRVLKPALLGIIYDEDRFRVDLFINPKFLKTSALVAQGYLPRPDASLSLTDTIGLEAAGTVGGKSTYNIQDRAIIALRNGRIRTDAAVASHIGLLVDDLVGEIDSRSLRYSGGLFWAPANDFIGQRRILGGGVGTQFDTWSDRDALNSTPLIVFLSDPSQIDLIVDGRLVTSRSYTAGNVEVDTSGLSEGSYPVLLRIHHANGSIEEQRRFFVKNAQMPVSGHPVVFAFAGVLANTKRNEPVSPSRTLFYELGTARRLSNAVALDISVLGTQHKAMVEGGAWLVTREARVRAAGLASSAGDWGALLQLGIAGRGPFTMNLDVRRISSHDGTPLVPLASAISTFDVAPPPGVQVAIGSYTQATASLGVRLFNGFLSVIGSYRKDRDLPADYTIGPSLSLPLITRNAVQVVFDASAQRSNNTSAAFAGLRVLLSSRHLSVGGTLGLATQADRSSNEGAVSRTVGSISAQWSQSGPAGREISVEGDADRNIGSSTVHAEALASGGFGNFRADFLKSLEDRHGAQYNLAFQSGMAVGVSGLAWGSRDLQQSAMIVAINGDAADATFKVLVNNVSRGEVKVGHRLTLFVPGYRTYNVRVVPTSSQNVNYDTAERPITLYPGNLRTLSWSANSYFTLFGRAISSDGKPIVNALMQTAKGIAVTDASGYFQIDARHDEPITVTTAGGTSCRLTLRGLTVKNDFASIGKVICQ